MYRAEVDKHGGSTSFRHASAALLNYCYHYVYSNRSNNLKSHNLFLRKFNPSHAMDDHIWSQDSSASIMTRLQTARPRNFGSILSRDRNVLFITAPRPVLGVIQSLIQRVPGAQSLWLKPSICETGHSVHLGPRSRVRGAILPLPHVFSLHGTVLSIDKAFTPLAFS